MRGLEAGESLSNVFVPGPKRELSLTPYSGRSAETVPSWQPC